LASTAAGGGEGGRRRPDGEPLSHLLGIEPDQDERLEDGLTYCMR